MNILKPTQVFLPLMLLISACAAPMPTITSTTIPIPVTATKNATTTPSQTPSKTPAPTGTATLPPTQTPLPVISLTPSPTPTQTAFTLSAENVKRITQLNKWGKGTPQETAWSPDGKLFFVGTSLGVYIYDAENLMEIRFIQTEDAVQKMAISPDGKILVTASNRVLLWDIQTGENIQELSGNFQGRIHDTSFSPAGSWLAAIGNQAGGGDPPWALHVWRTSDWALLYSKGQDYCGNGATFSFSLDERQITFDGGCGPQSIINSSTGEEILSSFGRLSWGNAIFTADPRKVIIGAYLFDLDTQKTLKIIPNANYSKLIISQDRKTLAILGGWDEKKQVWTNRVWDIESWQQRFVIEHALDGVSFSPDGSQLLGITDNGNLEFWDTQAGNLKTSLAWSKPTTSLAFGNLSVKDSAPMPILLAGNAVGEVSLINSENGETVQIVSLAKQAISAVAMHPNGIWLAIGVDKKVIVYDLAEDKIIQTFTLKIDSDGVFELSFSKDGEAIASSVNWFGNIQAWNILSGKEIDNPGEKAWLNAQTLGGTQTGHLIELKHVKMSDSSVTYQISDRFTSEILAKELSVDGIGICAEEQNFVVSANLRYLAVGCELPMLPIWDLNSDALVYDASDHQFVLNEGFRGNITDIEFSPYGSLLASSGYDETIRFWDAGSGELLITIFEHACTVEQIAFSPDGRYLASSSCDGTLRLWGLSN